MQDEKVLFWGAGVSCGEGNRSPSYELILEAGHALDTLRVGVVEDRMATVCATEDSALAATGAQEGKEFHGSIIPSSRGSRPETYGTRWQTL